MNRVRSLWCFQCWLVWLSCIDLLQATCLIFYFCLFPRHTDLEVAAAAATFACKAPSPLLSCGWRHRGIASFPLRSAPSLHLLWRRKVSYTGSCTEVLLSPICHLFTGNLSAGFIWFVCAASLGWAKRKKKNLQCYFYPDATQRVRWSRFSNDSH